MHVKPVVLNIASWFLMVGITLIAVSDLTAKESSSDAFPVYESIKPNVDFWTKIYSQYHTQQGVIHDADNLEIVYEVIDLKPRSKRGSRQYNRKLLRTTKGKYKAILEKLAKGNLPQTSEEKRVAALFGANPDPLILLEAMEKIRFQRGQKDRFKDGIIRSGKYLEEIKSIIRSYGLPEDLAYLPHVESSFNYKAYSKFGAAGIWQFTYGTGKRYMKINYTVDERRDPIIAAHAASKLLKSNYKKLGSWALALTAYNHGVNSMLRAKKKMGDYENIVNNYEGRRFKFASKNFYSEFLAARQVAKNAETYFGTFASHKPVSVFKLKVPGYVSVKQIAAHFKLETKTIKSLNPALRRPVFKEQKYIPKGYQLNLPDNKTIQTLAGSIPSDILQKKQKRSLFYYVQKGDVAGSIARRHGITLQDLIWANNLNHRATIYVGQNLRIPTPEDSKLLAARFAALESAPRTKLKSKTAPLPNGDYSFPKVKLLENGDVKLLEKVNLEVVTGNLGVKRTYTRKGRVYGHIRVDTGETLGHYAEWLQVSTQSIRNLNGFRFGRGINFNDRIVIPLYRVGQQEFAEKRYEYHKEQEEDFLSAFEIDSVSVYEIKRGDNIWSLCRDEFELPFWLIRKYNPDLDFYRLKPFQKVIVPVVEKRNGNGNAHGLPPLSMN